MRKLDCVTLVVIQAASGCMMDGDASSVATFPEATADYATLTSIGNREVSVASSANAKCVLSSAATGNDMPVWADDSGIVHLWTAAEAPGGEFNRFVLTCEEPTGSTAYNLDLGDSATFTPAVPKLSTKNKRTVLPPLPNPETADPKELRSAGYPPRPPKDASTYRDWLSIVSRPMTKVAAQPHSRDDVKFGPATNNTSQLWAGLALNKANTRYNYAVGVFTVPTNGLHLANPTNAAFWVGLGGINALDGIIQAGTFFESNGYFAQYKAFLEFYPGGPNFFEFFASPGDSLYVSVWEGDSSCNFAFTTGFGCFYLGNQTTGEFITTPGVPYTPGQFTGNSCEGAVERQPGSRLAQWSGAPQMRVDCWDINQGYHTFDSDPYLKTRLINPSSQTLAQSNQVSYNELNLTWVKEK